MRENYPRSREEWFIPRETTISLPDGRQLTVEGIPYEGWGTCPGKYAYFFDYVETPNGGFTFSTHLEWLIPARH